MAGICSGKTGFLQTETPENRVALSHSKAERFPLVYYLFFSVLKARILVWVKQIQMETFC